ncbi:unnamed protein product [Diplocarpon coronariae]
MAAALPPESFLLEDVFNHVALPTKLPGRREENLNNIGDALAGRLSAALAKISDSILDPTVGESLQRSLNTARRVNLGGRLMKSSLLDAFRHLNTSDFILAHVAEQNAALLIRGREDSTHGEEVVFEVFEVSPLSEPVLAVKGPLQWDFPGNSVAIPIATFDDPKFQNQLATLLERASSESVKCFAAAVIKDGSYEYESRDTVNPALVAQVLMSILVGIGGRRIYPKLLRKHVRDEVSWNNGGEQPWRRAPFWLALRVAAQRHFIITSGAEEGHIYYKFLMCMVISQLLVDCTLQLSLETLHHLKAKLCRRMVKLENDKNRASPQTVLKYQELLAASRSFISRSISSATAHINTSWKKFKESSQRKILEMPMRAANHHLSLRHSGQYLRAVLNNNANSWMQRTTAPTTARPGIPTSHISGSPTAKPSVKFAATVFELSEFEEKIEKGLNHPQAPQKNLETQCMKLSQDINLYLGKVSMFYDHDPEQKSLMLLNVMELWMHMDKVAIMMCKLLENYNSGFPANILDVLQIASVKDMLRLQNIRTYLKRREISCSNTTRTIFDDPAKGCFAELYFDESKDSLALQELHKIIIATAETSREKKEQEWIMKRDIFETMVQDHSEACCDFVVDKLTAIASHDEDCRKCRLQEKINRFRIVIHEHPLPTNLVQANLPQPRRETQPHVFVKKYLGLESYSYLINSIPSQFCLAGTKKPRLTSHYRTTRFPVTLAGVCFPNGMGSKLKYFDDRLKFSPGETSLSPSFAHQCRMMLPSPLSMFNSFDSFNADSNGPSSYEVVSSQSHCPNGVNPHEFMSFQALMAGKARRWPQILVELGSSNINFSTEASVALIRFLALQVGADNGSGYLGVIHGIFIDPVFCKKLLAMLNQRLDAIASNWRDANCMESLITIGLRLLDFGSGVAQSTIEFIMKARKIAVTWISSLQAVIQDTHDAITARRCSQYAFSAALLCRRTFAIYLHGKCTLDSAAIRCFVESSIALQNNMSSDPLSMSQSTKIALVRDLKTTFQMRRILKSFLQADPESLTSALSHILPNLEDDSAENYSGVDFLPSSHDWEIWIEMLSGGAPDKQFVLISLLEGHLFVNGKPMGKMSAEWRDSEVVKRVFGSQNLLTYQSSLPGMTYMLALRMNGYHIHLGSRQNQIIVQARAGNSTLEYVPPEVFGTGEFSDLPGEMIDGRYHWIDVASGLLEIRAGPSRWTPRPTNFFLNTRLSQARSATSTHQIYVVDPHSTIFGHIVKPFENFESRRQLTVYQSKSLVPGPHGMHWVFERLIVSLPRLQLLFFVNDRHRLQCSQLNVEIDADQDCGTWYGLQSKLVVREVAKKWNPDGQFYFSSPLAQRSVLVPTGTIGFEPCGPHITTVVKNEGSYDRFLINDVLGRLDCAAEPRLLYLKAAYHALTSFVVPDPLTGRTGTEEAMQCLKSAHCQPWCPITLSAYRGLGLMLRLTPQRDYYPPKSRTMQKTTWNEKLTTHIQSDGYREIIDTILIKSRELSAFDVTGPHMEWTAPSGSSHLIGRGHSRRRIYQRPLDEDDIKPSQAEPYVTRDRVIVNQCQANVLECTRLLRSWPSSLHTTPNLAIILQEWPELRGFCGKFEDVLISDLLDIQWDKNWGPLVNLCRESSSSDLYTLSFLLGTIAFGAGVGLTAMDKIRTLIAYCTVKDLKTIDAPRWLIYTEFADQCAPQREEILSLIGECFTEFDAAIFSEEDLAKISRLRREVWKLKNAHEVQQLKDAVILADFFLDQWPCSEPRGGGLLTEVLIDVEEAIELIRPKWLHAYQNHELSAYLAQVQRVLDLHSKRSKSTTSALPPKTENVDVYPIRARGSEIISLSRILRRIKPRSNVSLPTATFEKLSMPALPEKPCSQFLFNNSGLSNPFPEIQELTRIISDVSSSSSAVRLRYAEDLALSVRALQKHKGSGPKERQAPVDSEWLRKAAKQANLRYRHELHRVETLVESEYVEQIDWLKQGGLWPATKPVPILETLRSVTRNGLDSGVLDVILDYALSITSCQRVCRLDDALQKDNKQRLAEEQENEGHSNWHPKNYPDWLLLEIDANLLIRPDQVNVALATIAPQSGSNSVLQMNMGQGKTSCIMPMAAAVLANGKDLLRVIVPKSLLVQTAQLLHARLGGLIGRELRHIPFSRQTPTNAPTVQAFRKIHEDVQISSGIVIALPENLLSFKLSGLQRLCEGRNLEAADMIDAERWLSQRARDIIDECDSILALRTQLIYPSGAQKAVDGHPMRWEIAEALLGRVNSHLHSLQQKFPQSIEFRMGEVGFPAVFFLRPDVENELMERLVGDICSGQTSIFPADCSETDREMIGNFISKERPKKRVTTYIHKIFKDKPALRQAIYLLRGLLVHRILLMTLKRRWNVQYGLHPDRDPVAVPYHAKGTPSDQAEWGHPDVAIMFTCLAFYYSGLSPARLRQALEHVLKSNDPTQVYDTFCQSSSLPDSLRSWSAINVDDETQLHEIWSHVRYNVNVINYFLNNFVFPRHAKQFEVKLQASGWDLPSFSVETRSPHMEFSSTIQYSNIQLTTGFSGTNDGKRMLPLTVQQGDLEGLSHTNALVLTYLLEPRNRRYIPAENRFSKHISESELLQMIHNEKIRVLIDAGAQILEMDNFNLVRKWLEIDLAAVAAVFFDESSKPMVIYRNSTRRPVSLVETPFADNMGDCLVYLDEAHTRGTDLKLPIDACGALTLGLGQTKDHTVQAAMRLRQLGTTQSLVFFAPPEVSQSILEMRRDLPGGKQFANEINSSDVIRWLLEQTCRGMDQLLPLYFSQGTDFCRRTQAALDDPDYLTKAPQRERYVRCLLQKEQQTLEELYGNSAKPKLTTVKEQFCPELGRFMEKLETLRQSYQDAGTAVHGSALQEVEQEREVAYEIEAVREMQIPAHYTPLKFPGLHNHLRVFALTGKMARTVSPAYAPAFTAMQKLTVGKKYEVSSHGTSGRLYVSSEFMNTIEIPIGGTTYDNFQRPVQWILWSPVSQVAIILVPEELELLLPIVKSPISYIISYAAPLTRKMLHFDNLKYFSIPDLPSGWRSPDWLRTEIGVYSGRLYFEYSDYNLILNFLGVHECSGRIEEIDCSNSDEGSKAKGGGNATNRSTPRGFARKPLSFMQEWLAVQGKGRDFSETPMGYICQGRQLSPTHSFFVQHEGVEEQQASIPRSRIVDEAVEEDGDQGVLVHDNEYGPVREDQDNFDYAILKEIEPSHVAVRNVIGGSGHLRSPPSQVPVPTMPLCILCEKLNLSTVFREREPSNFSPIHTLPLLSLRDSAESCDLCTLFLSLVDFQSLRLQHTDPSSLACRIYLMDYGAIHSHKDGSAVDPVNGVWWEDRVTESVPRLHIDVDAQDGSIPVILPCGLQLKAGDGSEGKEEVLRGRIVQPELDLSLLKRWIGMCKGGHEAICNPGKMSDESDGITLRVIDTVEMRIVDLPSTAEYVVLSYVWGATKQLRLLHGNLEAFTKPFGLERPRENIPRTILDAMELVARLGERYLWVDALCIIQDDPADLAEQIQHMNDVYGCASLTIVAASGSDSNAGLPGLRADSRKSLIIDEEIQGVKLVTALPIFTSAVSASVWETRGWTMQEKVLSKRLIIFTAFQVFYHCNSAAWCEDAIWEPEHPYFVIRPGIGTMSPALQRTSLPSRTFTGMRKYAHLVTGYHTRQLTHQSDALNAFTGALTALSKELKTPFLWGLPKSLFDDTMIWQTPLHNPSLRRPGFPSWSWLGWKASDLPGDLEYPAIRSQHVETVSMVQWHEVTADGQQKLIGNPPTQYHTLPQLPNPTRAYRVPLQHLLRFWALSAPLYVCREPLESTKFTFEGQPSFVSFRQYGCENYAVGVREPDGEVKSFARVSLHTEWRKSQPDLLEFILISKRRSTDLWDASQINEGVDLMLVETKNEISYRVQLTRENIPEGNAFTPCLEIFSSAALLPSLHAVVPLDFVGFRGWQDPGIVYVLISLFQATLSLTRL